MWWSLTFLTAGGPDPRGAQTSPIPKGFALCEDLYATLVKKPTGAAEGFPFWKSCFYLRHLDFPLLLSSESFLIGPTLVLTWSIETS